MNGLVGTFDPPAPDEVLEQDETCTTATF